MAQGEATVQVTIAIAIAKKQAIQTALAIATKLASETILPFTTTFSASTICLVLVIVE